MALEHTEEDSEVFCPLPICKTCVRCNDRIQTSKITEALEHRANEIPLQECLKRRNDWDDEALCDVDWDAHKPARKNCPDTASVFVTKMCCRWLPTTAHLAKQSENGCDKCMHCDEPETQAHVFRCPGRRQWRTRFISNLSNHLRSTGTDCATSEALMTGVDAWLAGRKNRHKAGWRAGKTGTKPNTKKRSAGNSSCADSQTTDGDKIVQKENPA